MLLTPLFLPDPVRHQPLIAEAERALAVDPAVVTDLTHFTSDPQVLRKARAEPDPHFRGPLTRLGPRRILPLDG